MSEPSPKRVRPTTRADLLEQAEVQGNFPLIKDFIGLGHMRQLSEPQTAVWFAVWWHRNDKTGTCFPSIGRLTKLATCGDRQTQKAIRALEKFGYLKVVQQGGGRGRANVYELKLPKTPPDGDGDSKRDSPSRHGGVSSLESPARHAHKPRHAVQETPASHAHKPRHGVPDEPYNQTRKGTINHNHGNGHGRGSLRVLGKGMEEEAREAKYTKRLADLGLNKYCVQRAFKKYGVAHLKKIARIGKEKENDDTVNDLAALLGALLKDPVKLKAAWQRHQGEHNGDRHTEPAALQDGWDRYWAQIENDE